MFTALKTLPPWLILLLAIFSCKQVISSDSTETHRPITHYVGLNDNPLQ